MSTGISISSINRIKELAEERKFKEALEILDTQNLDKSINPQFLKISGEIFRENKRYYDSRRILLKAHQMAPQGTRILHEMIQLYLELGYFTKAQKYYDQYMFYTTPDDTQKDYVEYIMKKATGAEVKDLAAILIPILERMPEDRWNFEAILLYHKMDRKDMALEESRYILENFKESVYVQPVIDYIDDKLDVDKWFYVYPKEEQPEDEDLYGDLIKLEEKILENDYLSMYPPEARIMVEADDNDAPAVAPAKEKKPKRVFGKNAKKKESADEVLSETETKDDSPEGKKPQDTDDNKPVTEDTTANTDAKANVSDAEKSADQSDDKSDKQSDDKSVDQSEKQETATQSSEKKDDEQQASSESTEKKASSDSIVDDVKSEEEHLQKEREAALEKILSKKFDRDKLRESAKQVAQAVKEIDTTKAKQQVKTVADTVKDNVKKASNAFNEAVGTKQAVDISHDTEDSSTMSDEDEILDGIIESVLEPPKKAVGQVVMNEELDAIIPDSLEAMSEKEIADIEAKKEEFERLELEALEATLKMEEEKKAKKLAKSKQNVTEESETEQDVTEESSEAVEEKQDTSDNNSAESEEQSDTVQEKESEGYSYAELKSKFMETDEEKPLDSLGFITVVHSDVDEGIEDAVPDAAGMLRQMIDNKEFYSGESSLGFESKASYENHGFEVEDYDFDVYRNQSEDASDKPAIGEVLKEESKEESQEEIKEETSSVQEIFTKENVVAFEDVVYEDANTSDPVTDVVEESVVTEEVITEEPVIEEPVTYEEAVIEEPPVVYEEVVTEEPVTYEEPVIEEPVTYEEAVIEEPPVVYEEVVTEEPVTYEEPAIEEPVAYEEAVIEEPPVVYEEVVTEEPVTYEEPAIEEPVTYEEPAIEEPVTYEEPAIEEPVTYEEAVIEEPPVIYEEVVAEEPLTYEELVTEEPIVYAEPVTEEPTVYEETVVEEPTFIIGEDTILEVEETMSARRERLRADIVLTNEMEYFLQELKESR